MGPRIQGPGPGSPPRGRPQSGVPLLRVVLASETLVLRPKVWGFGPGFGLDLDPKIGHFGPRLRVVMAKQHVGFKAESLGFWAQNRAGSWPRGPQNRPIWAPFGAQNQAQNPRLSALNQGCYLAGRAHSRGTPIWAYPGEWDPGIWGPTPGPGIRDPRI